MFHLTKPKLPVTEEQQRWTDAGFLVLAKLLGRRRLFESTVVTPTPEHFPDRYDRSEAALQLMFNRVAAYLQVDPAEVQLTLLAEEYDLTRSLVPFHEGHSSGAGGLYHHDDDGRTHISVNERDLKDPMTLVATLAHELGHVILLRPGLVDRKDPDMEPLNDLLTVFLGFGIFTANSAFRFEQHEDGRTQGWSVKRAGYLSEELFGYALARFALKRGEPKPRWALHLSSNIARHVKRSADWLIRRQEPNLFRLRGPISHPLPLGLRILTLPPHRIAAVENPVAQALLPVRPKPATHCTAQPPLLPLPGNPQSWAY